MTLKQTQDIPAHRGHSQTACCCACFINLAVLPAWTVKICSCICIQRGELNNSYVRSPEFLSGDS